MRHTNNNACCVELHNLCLCVAKHHARGVLLQQVRRGVPADHCLAVSNGLHCWSCHNQPVIGAPATNPGCCSPQQAQHSSTTQQRAHHVLSLHPLLASGASLLRRHSQKKQAQALVHKQPSAVVCACLNFFPVPPLPPPTSSAPRGWRFRAFSFLCCLVLCFCFLSSLFLSGFSCLVSIKAGECVCSFEHATSTNESKRRGALLFVSLLLLGVL